MTPLTTKTAAGAAMVEAQDMICLKPQVCSLFIDLTSEPMYKQSYVDSTDVFFFRLALLDACNHRNSTAAGAAMAGARDAIHLEPQVCSFYLLFSYH